MPADRPVVFGPPRCRHVAPTEQCRVAATALIVRGQFFFSRCCSSVFGRSADEVEVNLGSLDAPDQLTPTYELWTVRRESWLPPFPLAKRYEHDRETMGRTEEQVALLAVFGVRVNVRRRGRPAA